MLSLPSRETIKLSLVPVHSNIWKLMISLNFSSLAEISVRIYSPRARPYSFNMYTAVESARWVFVSMNGTRAMQTSVARSVFLKQKIMPVTHCYKMSMISAYVKS